MYYDMGIIELKIRMVVAVVLGGSIIASFVSPVPIADYEFSQVTQVIMVTISFFGSIIIIRNLQNKSYH